MAKLSRFSLNDNSSGDRYPSGSMLAFPKIDLDKSNILEPREGIGGHCLPKDTKMFLNSSKSIKSKILEAAIEVDNEYRRHLALSVSYQTVGESLSLKFPDVSKSGDRDTGETVLEITSIGNLVPAPTYSSNPK